jgi:hypothetical protein
MPVVFADEIEKDVIYSLPTAMIFGGSEAAVTSN